MKNYVKNPLSYAPGGIKLRFDFENSNPQIQDRIKYPKKYIEKVEVETLAEGKVITQITDLTNNQVIYKK